MITLYVERSPEAATEAAAILADARDILHISGVQGIRVIHRYRVSKLPENIFDAAARSIFADPASDRLSPALVLDEEEQAFAYAYLPGQFDHRARAAEDALHILGADAPQVQVATVVAVTGPVSAADLSRLKGYLINPVDSREVPAHEPPATDSADDGPGSDDDPSTAAATGIRALADADPEAAETTARRRGLAMTGADLQLIARAMDAEEREPTEAELRILDTYWSDHCRHQTFLTELSEVRAPEGSPEAAALARYRELRRELGYGAFPPAAAGSAGRPETLMDMATIAAKVLRRRGALPDLDVSEEVNAAAVVIPGPEDWLLLFKNETHNHPTEIEPYGGASTCLGGAIRDPMSGRGTVFQGIRVSGGADPRTPVEETRSGKLPQRLLALESARGFASYGNQFGLATGLVAEHYHPGYEAKRLEAGAVLGAVPRHMVRREQPRPGDVVVLVGGRTGRDGVGGATGSSKGHSEESVAVAGAEVQKGNPPVERGLYRLFRKPEALRLIKRCNDFGAGGVAVAVGELAAGIDIDLDAVPRKYAYLTAAEVAISESQERMAVVLAAGDAESFLRLAAAENLEGTVIARVTAGERLVMRSAGARVVDLSRELLDSAGAPKRARVRIPGAADGETPHRPGDHAPEKPGAGKAGSREAWIAWLSRLNRGTHPGLIERFDASIGRSTVLLPLGGVLQRSPAQGTVMRLPRLDSTGTPPADPRPAGPRPAGRDTRVSVAAYGFLPEIAAARPYAGGYLAVVEAVARAVASGADPERVRLSLQEYFPRPGDDPERWGLPAGALLGALDAQLDLETPAIGGKDSMSGSFEELDVPPTLIAFAFCAAEERHVRSPELKEPGNTLLLLSPGAATFTATDSRHAEPRPAAGPAELPDPPALQALLRLVHSLSNDERLRSVTALGADGVAAGLARASFGNHLGLRAGPDFAGHDPGPAGKLFAPAIGSFLLEVTPDFLREIREGPWHALVAEGVEIRVLGETGGQAIDTGEWQLSLDEAFAAWQGSLEGVFHSGHCDVSRSLLKDPPQNAAGKGDSGETSRDTETTSPDATSSRRNQDLARSVSTSSGIHPGGVIPVFPGTNCEYDTAEALSAAGGRARVVVLRTLTNAGIRESAEELARAIAESRMLILPGGFSAGDEPDGSGKFMAAFLRQDRVADAIRELLQERDGLILGICNGFQALVRLGLVPFGEIRERRPGDPLLAQNRIGHHVARMAWTRVASTKSPWLAATAVDELYAVPVSHGEGRFLVDPAVAEALLREGQVATRYADPTGAVAEEEPWNPNGSVLGIEGITSPDGRILGKMGHVERVAPGLFRNHPAPGDIRLFESGVRYFR